MATLTSTKIKNTYDALLKASDNDAIGSSAKQITDGLGNGTPLYISTTQIGIGVTPEATYDLHVYSNAKVGGNLTVTGDLTVEGTTTTIDTQTLTVEDPLIEVASNNTSTDAVDIGWYGKYAPSGTVLYAGLFRDTGDSKFKLFRNLEEQPTTTVNTGGTGYTVATLVANLEGNVTGDITGNADTATALETARTIQVSGDIAGSASFDGTADINISTTIQPNSVALGTDTTGNYVATISGTANEITVSDSGSESAAVTISLPSSISVDVTGDLTGDVYNADGSIILNTGDNSIDAVLSNGVRATTQTQGDNSTKLATTAYVDSAIGGQDTLAEILANGNTTGGTDIDVSVGDSINFAGSGSTSTVIEHDIYDTRIINDNSLGGIILRSATTVMQNAAGTETSAFFRENGAVELYYDNSKKFETTSTGVTVTGGASFTDNIDINGNNKHIRFIDTYGNWQIKAGDGANNFKIHSQSLAADYLIIDGSGNVGIGETPSSWSAFTVLQVEKASLASTGGDMNLMSNSYYDGTAYKYIGSGAAARQYYNTDGTMHFYNASSGTAGGTVTWNERMRIDSSGNVAIGGSTESDSLLTVRGADTNNKYIRTINNNGTAYFGTIADGTGVLESNTSLKFTTGSSFSERMRIDSSGRVGIGTDDPKCKLNVTAGVGTSGLELQRWHYSTTPDRWNLRLTQVVSGDDVAWDFKQTNNNTDYGSVLTLKNGSVGIGTTSPSTVLDVRNSINIGGAGQDSNIYFQQNTSNQARINYYTDNSMIFDNWNGGYYFRTTSSFTPRVTILNGGNVGIGTTSPSAKLDIAQGSASPVALEINTENTFCDVLMNSFYSTSATRLRVGTNDFQIHTNGSQNLTVTSAGAVGIGVSSSSGSRMHVKAPTGTSTICVIQTGDNANNNVKAIEFRDFTFTDCGEITVNGSTNTTAYGTSSDYRLKEDYKDFNGLDIVSNIPVYDFQWKKSGTRAYGVQAHELQEALPQAVNGEKDGENYQSVDYSKIVPVLLKSIQELKARIEILENN